MSGRRVVLLARPGPARERAQAALSQAGADVAAVLDPSACTEDDVRATGADALMVILDPAVERVLETFDGVLADPGYDVLFEDADVAARREGWDAARWARHLDAKLHGHGNVLPPEERAVQAARPALSAELDALRAEVASLPDLPGAAVAAASPTGAVIAVAGVGGPDAVRQLLAGLPGGFSRPVVVHMAQDGVQLDRLARQMQRATPLRVEQAEHGVRLQAGAVYLLPTGMGVVAGSDGLAFATADDAPFAAAPPADSALLLLSGADPALVDLALSIRWGGGLVLGQSPPNCFDPSASDALVARGGEAFPITSLPSKLLQRWPA